MNDTKLEELKKACKKEKSHTVRVRAVAVRMVLVFDTAGTTPARHAVEGSKSPWIPLVNKVFLGSVVPERPHCIVPAAARRRSGSSAG